MQGQLSSGSARFLNALPAGRVDPDWLSGHDYQDLQGRAESLITAPAGTLPQATSTTLNYAMSGYQAGSALIASQVSTECRTMTFSAAAAQRTDAQ